MPTKLLKGGCDTCGHGVAIAIAKQDFGGAHPTLKGTLNNRYPEADRYDLETIKPGILSGYKEIWPALHGEPGAGFEDLSSPVGTLSLSGKYKNLTGDELAQQLKTAGVHQGQNVVLWSCNAGTDAFREDGARIESTAAKVCKATGATVRSPRAGNLPLGVLDDFDRIKPGQLVSGGAFTDEFGATVYNDRGEPIGYSTGAVGSEYPKRLVGGYLVTEDVGNVDNRFGEVDAGRWTEFSPPSCEPVTAGNPLEEE